MTEKITCYSLNAVTKKGNLKGYYPEFFDRLTTLAERAQDIRERGLSRRYKLERVDMTEYEAGQRQTEIMFRSVKCC